MNLKLESEGFQAAFSELWVLGGFRDFQGFEGSRGGGFRCLGLLGFLRV